MEILTVTANATSLRYVNVNGREFAVANIKIIVPGVLNGSKGPLYYPPDEIANALHVHSWNGKPLVVKHPVSGEGLNISANNPETFLKQEIGRVYNAKIDHSDKGLEVEGWFDVELVKKHDNRIWQALNSKNKIEVSTGLYTENVDAPMNSAHNGKPYTYIAKNYRPDHLAILPDDKGACSITDGCGVFNRGDDDKPKLDDKTVDTNTLNPIGNDMKDRTKAIESLVGNCDCYKGNGAKDTLLKLSDVEFNKVLIDNAGKIVEDEIKNEDTKFLNWMATASEDVQKAFVASMKKTMMGRNATPPAEDPNKKPVVPDPNNPNPAPALTPEEEAKKKALMAQQNVAVGNNQMTEEQYLATLPPSIREVVNNAKKVTDTEKQRLIGQLTAHITDNTQKTKAIQVLTSKTLEDLQERALFAPPVAQTNNQQQPMPNFFGAIGGPINNNDGYNVRDDVLDIPTVNYADEAKILNNAKKS